MISGKQRVLELKSPAKVNLRLEVLDKREDGYHEIRTVFQKIDLCDRVRVALEDEKGVRVTTDHPRLAVDRSNLTYRAAQALLGRSGYRAGISIHIDKKIPLGAGLGGGSSNAAATLKALNELTGLGLCPEELTTVGARIGADVPFFLTGAGAAVGTGIGERLKEIALPALWYVLIYPDFEVSTAWAYQNFRLTKRMDHLSIKGFLTTPEGISKILRNDLEEVVAKQFFQIDQMKEILICAGAMGTLMSGSGPTVFGIFPKKRGADRAFKEVKAHAEDQGWLAFESRGLKADLGHTSG